MNLTDADNDSKHDREDLPACDPTMSRKEFFETVLKRGAIAGAILASPQIVDKFLVAQPAVAGHSSTASHSET